MIEMKKDRLRFSFPEVHPEAVLDIEFQRTLRIPDDGGRYPLPPGLGRFPLRHVDDFAPTVPESWIRHGGVMLPMRQAEAMWINFMPRFVTDRETGYPFAVKVAAGKVCAISGEGWSNELHRDPQDYLALPKQPWLDGFSVGKGEIRQFTAMRLGEGYTAEEQLTAQAEHGGIQIIVYPMKREVFQRRFPKIERRRVHLEHFLSEAEAMPCAAPLDMGLAPGGRMKQEIYEDPFTFTDWNLKNRSRCYIHLVNSLAWRAVTGAAPPTPPPTARDYTEAGLPWFDWYDEDARAVPATPRLTKLESVAEIAAEKGEDPVPDDAPLTVRNVRVLRKGLRRQEVREGEF